MPAGTKGLKFLEILPVYVEFVEFQQTSGAWECLFFCLKYAEKSVLFTVNRYSVNRLFLSCVP